MCIQEGRFQLKKESKIRLVSLLNHSIKTGKITTTPNHVMHKTASSLGQIYDGAIKKLYLPFMRLANLYRNN